MPESEDNEVRDVKRMEVKKDAKRDKARDKKRGYRAIRTLKKGAQNDE